MAVALVVRVKVIIQLEQEAMRLIFHRVVVVLAVIVVLVAKEQVRRLVVACTFNPLQALVAVAVVVLVWQLPLTPLITAVEVVVALVYLALDQMEQLEPPILHKLLLMPQWWDKQVQAAPMDLCP
jgi:hypothetical protein